jgi:hypothetical protein
VEEGESPFDPDMLTARATAILAGFVERREDVGKEEKGWVREKYIYACGTGRLVGDREGKSGKGNSINGQNQNGKKFPTIGSTKSEWYGERPRNHPVRDEKKAGKRNSTTLRCDSFYTNALGRRSSGEGYVGDTGYDHGEFEDTDEFYVQPVLKLKSFNPEAMAFQPGDRPNGM